MAPAAWLVRGGRHGEREEQALSRGLAIAGWDEVGDLSALPTKGALRQRISSCYPTASKAKVANWTGQLWRFRAEMELDDYVVLPLKTRPGQLAIGRVSGPYRFDADAAPGYQHLRPVDWIRKDVPRDDVQRDLLDSMGSLLTICGLHRFGAAERIANLAAGSVDPGPDVADERPQPMASTPAELAARAAEADVSSPFKLTIRELLDCWGVVRRTSSNIAQIETDLSEYGLTTKPPFTEGWIGTKVEIVPIGEEPGGEGGVEAGDAEDVQEASEFVPITLRVGMLGPANKDVASVRPEDGLDTATTRMLIENYSQLAVIDSQGNLCGAVSWESIGKARLSGHTVAVSDALVPARVVHPSEDLLSQLDEIYRRGYLFVRGADQSSTGIVTAADLTGQFGELTRPFVLIDEAERRLRRRVDEVFEVEELRQVARNPKKVHSAADFTLGSYGFLLKEPENFRKLAWPLDQTIFLACLEEVRKIRNDIMHFTLDPLTAELDTLAGFVQMLRTVDPRG
ncbi:restriction system protein [Saccharopolyspora dendranthemae]|uniref:Restriction system protein n=2 Tax=Saccharopolyspora dendranthemae TaxID=1181886 RepID=A0A561VAV3_9PSEU|nr:restriction system protein [Saccharopolyspora dendranthemae]